MKNYINLFRVHFVFILILLSVYARAEDADIYIHFDQHLHDWDGFGVNYVETRHTRDYSVFSQDYGGFKYLSEQDRQKVMDMIFNEDGLKPGIIKAFVDAFHEPVNDNDDPFDLDMSKFDHTTTTHWMRYFYHEAEKRVSTWGGELTFLAGLYGPPDWMSLQKTFRGRDLDPAMKYELAEYCVSWAKYLRETEGLNVKYISMHNEGEDARRWTASGQDDTTQYHHDFNMWWDGPQIADFLAITDEVLYANNMLDVKFTTGETTNWLRLHDMWLERKYQSNFAEHIKNNPQAMQNLGLITSHGFMHKYDPTGVNILRSVNPGLHAWTTSYTWDPMTVAIVEDARNLIYKVGCNALIPWAIVHNAYESDKLHPPMTFRVSSNACSPFLTDDGNLTVTKAYYFFKQICRAGQPGMSVAQVETTNDAVQAIAFARKQTCNPDAFVIINNSDVPQRVTIKVEGANESQFFGFRTSPEENYQSLGTFTLKNKTLTVECPPASAATFYNKQ